MGDLEQYEMECLRAENAEYAREDKENVEDVPAFVLAFNYACAAHREYVMLGKSQDIINDMDDIVDELGRCRCDADAFEVLRGYETHRDRLLNCDVGNMILRYFSWYAS